MWADDKLARAQLGGCIGAWTAASMAPAINSSAFANAPVAGRASAANSGSTGNAMPLMDAIFGHVAQGNATRGMDTATAAHEPPTRTGGFCSVSHVALKW